MTDREAPGKNRCPKSSPTPGTSGFSLEPQSRFVMDGHRRLDRESGSSTIAAAFDTDTGPSPGSSSPYLLMMARPLFLVMEEE